MVVLSLLRYALLMMVVIIGVILLLLLLNLEATTLLDRWSVRHVSSLHLILHV